MDDLFKLQDLILKLKTLKKKGWVIRGIPNPESVADHSYSMTILVMVMAQKLNLDIEKCLKLSLIHELGESKIGDITPQDTNSSEKAELEDKAIKDIVKETGFTFIKDLWQEYSDNKTKESILVKDMDKIEMVIQALNYEKKYSKDLTEFYDYVKNKLVLEESKQIFDEVIRKRE